MTLSIAVAGTGPFGYQWQFNGTNLPNSINIITSVAGNGIAGYSGDGGAATSAELNHPAAVAVDASGNLFVADVGNNRIRKIDVNGVITTVAGNGTRAYSGDGGAATNASLYEPTGVAVDASGNLFVADTFNSRLRKVTANGIITTVAGNGSGGYSGDGGAATNASPGPDGVAIDAFGNLYIADGDGNRIRKLDANGIITTVAGNGEWMNGCLCDGGPATSASVSHPSGMAVDASGNLYIADIGNMRIRKVDASGIITSVAGGGTGLGDGDGGLATSAALSAPSDVKLDATGNLFVADKLNNRVRKINVNGVITTVAGNGSAGYSGDGGAAINASLNYTAGVAVDTSGNLFIADEGNNRIRKVARFDLPTLTLTNISASSAGYYRVIVTSPFGSVTSSNALVTVLPAPPAITTQPLSQTVAVGSPVAFIVTASGLPPLSYQWFFDTNNITGATNSALSFTNTQFNQAGNYSVAVKGPTGNVTSSNALLVVKGIGTNIFDFAADFSTTQNPNGPWTYGGFDSFNVFHSFTNYSEYPGFNFPGLSWNDGGPIYLAKGDRPGNVLCGVGDFYSDPFHRDNPFELAEQFIVPQGVDGTYELIVTVDAGFYSDNVTVSQNGQTILTASPVAGACSGFPIICDNTNYGSTYLALKGGDTLYFHQDSSDPLYFEAVLSQPGVLTAISTQPTNEMVLLGSPAAFSVAANGLPPLTYQWFFGTNTIAGATNSTLNLTNVQYSQKSNYSVVVTGPKGTATSSNALLTVLVPVPPSVTVQPHTQMVPFGENATLTVGAAGSQPLSYQWYVGASGDTSNPITGATNSSFTTPQLFSGITVWVAVQNAFGTAKSASTLITLVPANSVLLGLELNAGSPSLTLFGTIGTTYRLEFVSDLRSTNWAPLFNLPLPSNPYRFTDTGATNPARFYRLRVSP